MKKFILFLIQLFLFSSINGQDIYDKFQREVASLKSKDEIKNYWDTIRFKDQFYRAQRVVDSIDYDNVVKMVELIQKFGYPSEKVFGKYAGAMQYSLIPLNVFRHQYSQQVRYATFPILYKAFQDSLLSFDWLTCGLETVFEGKFREGYRRGPCKLSYQDILEMIRLINLDTIQKSKIDIISILRQEKYERNAHKGIKFISTCDFYKSKESLITRDGVYFLRTTSSNHGYSENAVKITFINGLTIIQNEPTFWGDYYIINKKGNWEYYKSGVFEQEFPKSR